MQKLKMILLILLLALLLIGTQGCKTLPVSQVDVPGEIILPLAPERPELPEVFDMKTAALQIALLRSYAMEWETWGFNVQRIVGD